MIRTLSPLWRTVQSPSIVITIDDVSSVTTTCLGKGFSVSALPLLRACDERMTEMGEKTTLQSDRRMCALPPTANIYRVMITSARAKCGHS
jgi:hypothetical protein